MKVTLPIIGQVKTGKDADEVVTDKVVKRVKNKALDILGGFLDFGTSKLSSEKSISSKLLQANRGWVYINNDVIAKEVSKIEFELYSIGMKGGEITYTEITEHPLLDLLDKPNSTTSKTDMVYITQSHKKLTGDAFWLLDQTGSQITNIFTLPPDKVTLNLGNPLDGTADLVESYTYKDTIDGKQVEQTYGRDEIIHFKNPNPTNPFRGYGAVEAAADVIDVDNLTNLTTKKFFENGAITNFVLSTESKITDEQLKRIKAELRAANAGANNAYKAMILGGGLKPVDISYSNKEMEFLSQLAWYRDKIMVLFGNTKASIGIIDDVNRASHKSSMVEWKRTTVKPDMSAIVDTLNQFLVPMYGNKLVLTYCDPVEEDEADDIEAANQLYTAGIMTLNEAREKVELDPIAGGDEVKATGQVVPRLEDNTPKALRNINLKAILRQRKMFSQLQKNQELKEKAKPVIRQILHSEKSEDSKPMHQQFTNEQLLAYYEKQMNVVDVLQNQFEEAVKKFIGKIEKQVLENLDTEITSKSVKKELFSEDDLLVEAQLDFTPILMQEAAISGQAAYALIGKDEPYLPYNLTDVIKRNVEKFTQSMLDTDRDKLVATITDGIKNGQSITEIRNRISEDFATYSKNQSQLISRTEVLRASNMAAEDAYMQSGVVEAKQWLTFGATDECAQYEGKIETLGGNFYDSDNTFQDGDPPLHPNCRCVILPVVAGVKAFVPVPIHEKEILEARIKELEDQVDKRTKSYKEIKEKFRTTSSDDKAYIKSLESLIGVSDDQTREAKES